MLSDLDDGVTARRRRSRYILARCEPHGHAKRHAATMVCERVQRRCSRESSFFAPFILIAQSEHAFSLNLGRLPDMRL